MCNRFMENQEIDFLIALYTKLQKYHARYTARREI